MCIYVYVCVCVYIHTYFAANDVLHLSLNFFNYYKRLLATENANHETYVPDFEWSKNDVTYSVVYGKAIQ